MKSCYKCKLSKSLDSFHVKNKALGTLRDMCKQCSATYHREHYLKNKVGYVARATANKTKYMEEFLDYLEGKSCTDCGNSDMRVLEFDHVSGKSFEINQKAGKATLASFMDEINKCEIVCSNCHKIRTHSRANTKKHIRASVV